MMTDFHFWVNYPFKYRLPFQNIVSIAHQCSLNAMFSEKLFSTAYKIYIYIYIYIYILEVGID